MEILLNTSQPMIIIAYTIIAVILIVIAKKVEVPAVTAFLIFASIALLIIHSVTLQSANQLQEELISQTYMSLAYDFILLLLSFISYLWIDDIVAKKKNKKSYDDSLSWFWDKI